MNNLKNMCKREKAEYIWEYYKLHLIAALTIVYIVGSSLYIQITKVEYVFNLTLVGSVIDENKKADLQNQLTNLVGKVGDKKKQAYIDVIPLDSAGNNEPISNQYMQKLITKLSVGELDIVTLDKNIFKSLVKQDAFLRLDNIEGLDLNSIKNENIEVSASDTNKAVYGISAENIKVFKDMGFDTHNKVIGIVASSKQKDKAVMVFKWLSNK